jgi:hypothetical protein
LTGSKEVIENDSLLVVGFSGWLQTYEELIDLLVCHAEGIFIYALCTTIKYESC